MFLKFGIIFLALAITFVAAAGVAIQKTGVVIVDVQKRDGRIYLPIPLLLVNTALSFAPVSSQVHIPEELQRHSDLIQAAAAELLQCPDGPFVEVTSRDDRVFIGKEGENIIVDVQSPDETVHIQVPIRATGKTIAKLARLEAHAEGNREFTIVGKN